MVPSARLEGVEGAMLEAPGMSGICADPGWPGQPQPAGEDGAQSGEGGLGFRAVGFCSSHITSLSLGFPIY